MPPLTKAARDRSSRWQLALFVVLVLAAFGGFFALGRADSDGKSVEPPAEPSAAGTGHHISLPNVRLTGSGNLPQLAAVSEPPKEAKPTPTSPPAEQTTAPAEPAAAVPDEAVPAAPVTTTAPAPTPAPAAPPAPSSSSGSSQGSNPPPVSFDDSG